jgi:hypothetical protein
LNRYLGKSLIESWLEKWNFPKSVILRWHGPGMLEDLKGRGVQLHAIIGSAVLISSVKKHVENRFTFGQTKEGKTVEDWEEILVLLEEASPSPTEDPLPADKNE